MSARAAGLLALAQLVVWTFWIGLECCARARGFPREGLPLGPAPTVAVSCWLAISAWRSLALVRLPRAIARSWCACSLLATLGMMLGEGWVAAAVAPFVLGLACFAEPARARRPDAAPSTVLALAAGLAAISPSLPPTPRLLAWVAYGLAAVFLPPWVRHRDPAGAAAPACILALLAIIQTVPAGDSGLAAVLLGVGALAMAGLALRPTASPGELLGAGWLLAVAAAMAQQPTAGLVWMGAVLLASFAGESARLAPGRHPGADLRRRFRRAHVEGSLAPAIFALPLAGSLSAATLADAVHVRTPALLPAVLLAPAMLVLAATLAHGRRFRIPASTRGPRSSFGTLDVDVSGVHLDAFRGLGLILSLAAVWLLRVPALPWLGIIVATAAAAWVLARRANPVAPRPAGRRLVLERPRWLPGPPALLPVALAPLRQSLQNLLLECLAVLAAQRRRPSPSMVLLGLGAVLFGLSLLGGSTR